MKTTYKISFIFLIYSLILILSGYINYLICYILIMFFHELGHIITIKLLKYKITSITIFPGGGIISTNIEYNINSLHLFLISISGITMQILLYLLMPNTFIYYDIFINLNTSLIIFNLLPIIPNDGYKIIISILEQFFSYKITNYIVLMISLISLFILLITTKNILIFTILYMINTKQFILQKHILNKFLLERYLHKKKYKKNKKIKNIKQIHKCRNNYMICDKIITEEEVLLDKYFMSTY